MKNTYCDKETLIVKALAAGFLEEALQEHANGCPACSEALLVGRFLRSGLDCPPLGNPSGEAATRLPDAGLVWWKAQLTAKRMAVERATRVVRVVRGLACLGGAAAVAWGFTAMSKPSPMNSSFVSCIAPFARLLSSSSAEMALFCTALAVLSILLGSAYILWGET